MPSNDRPQSPDEALLEERRGLVHSMGGAIDRAILNRISEIDRLLARKLQPHDNVVNFPNRAHH